jgi:hypothetical protein
LNSRCGLRDNDRVGDAAKGTKDDGARKCARCGKASGVAKYCDDCKRARRDEAARAAKDAEEEQRAEARDRARASRDRKRIAVALGAGALILAIGAYYYERPKSHEAEFGTIRGVSPPRDEPQRATDEPQRATDEPQRNAIKVSVPELIKAYSDNEIAANARFQGKLVEVTGIAQSINAELVGKGGYIMLALVMKSSNAVRASFDEDRLSDVSSLKAGQQVTVQCKVHGAALGIVVLEKCAVTGTGRPPE